MTELATTGPSTGLALISDGWTDSQVAALTQLGVEKASDADLQVYHHVCRRTGLDPFARQIYMIERKGKQTIQTGIDGFRLVARRAVDASGETLEFGDPEWCDAAGTWSDVWLSAAPPSAARVAVFRNGKRYPGIALYREYVQTYWKNGKELITSMWDSRPAGQLAKCAEALALRKAFPQDLSGLYTEDEIGKHDVVRGEATEPETTSRVVTAADLRGEPDLITAEQNQKIGALFQSLSIIDDVLTLQYAIDVIGRTIASGGELTRAEADLVIKSLEDDSAPVADVEDQVAANDPALDGGA